MNLGQMIIVTILVSAMVYLYVNGLGYELSFFGALAGVVTSKALALFLVPEKAPIVLVRANKEEETE